MSPSVRGAVSDRRRTLRRPHRPPPPGASRERLLGVKETRPIQRPPGPPVVLLDANMLFLVVEEHFPLQGELDRLLPAARVRVPESVRGEITRLAERGRSAARAALELSGRYPIAATGLQGDDALEALARETGAWTVTADRRLRERLESIGAGVLFPRGRHHLSRSPRSPPLP